MVRGCSATCWVSGRPSSCATARHGGRCSKTSSSPRRSSGTRTKAAPPSLYFYRDDSKIEVDLVDMTERAAPELIEIKSTTTYKADLARHLESVGDALGIPMEGRGVVMRSDESHVVNGVKHWSAHEWLMR